MLILRSQPNHHSHWKSSLPVPLASASSHKTMCSFPPKQLSQGMMTLMGLVDRNLSFPQDCKLPGSRNCVFLLTTADYSWRRLLRVPWTARRSKQSILKEISPEYSLEGLMLKLKLQYFGHLIWRTDSLEKTLMLERLKVGGEGDNRGCDSWMASPTWWTWVWASSGSWWWTGKLGVLQSMGSQKVGHNWVTELNCPLQCLGLNSCSINVSWMREWGCECSYCLSANPPPLCPRNIQAHHIHFCHSSTFLPAWNVSAQYLYTCRTWLRKHLRIKCVD